MIYTVILFRFVITVWILSILGILIYKISTDTLKKQLSLSVWLFFPILILTKKGRMKIEKELK